MISIKKIIFYSFLIVLFCIQVAHSDSIKTHESSTFYNLKFIVSIYKEKEGNYPLSWQEIVDKGYLTDPLKKDAYQILDVENRYRFVKMETPIHYGSHVDKIIVLAVRPGREGNYPDREGRWMMVETPSGSLETRKIPETVLASALEREGLSLSDYTEQNRENSFRHPRRGLSQESSRNDNSWHWPKKFPIPSREVLVTVALAMGMVGGVVWWIRRAKRKARHG